MGRVFCRWLSASTGRVESPKHFVRLTKEHREDLRIWHLFLEHFNGRALWMPGPVSNFDLKVIHGCGGIHGFQGFFPGEVECGAMARIMESGRVFEEPGAAGTISGGTGGGAMGRILQGSEGALPW